MFEWFRRIFRPPHHDPRQRFFDNLDALNAETGGGVPLTTKRKLGKLKLRSGTLTLADPQFMSRLEIPNVASDEVTISASLWQYPSGATTVTALSLRFGEPTGDVSRRKIGEVGIDSAKLVVVDKADEAEHWAEVGKDRIGVISTARDDTVLRLLKKRFKLKAVQVNPVRAEVAGPVSESLEKEITEFLNADPKYAASPYMHFYVQTNNSFDRANRSAKEWDFMPVGNADTPLMFVCGTGRGDGCYDVFGEFAGDNLSGVTITFIEDAGAC